MSNGLILKMNMCYKGVSREHKFCMVKGKINLLPPARSAGSLLYTTQGSANYGLITLQLGLSYIASGASD
jgi:hypothetical protein